MSSEVFVHRVVTVDGQEVSCRFFKPMPDRGDFCCRLELELPEGIYSRQVYGVDEVQALLLAMKTVH